MEETAPIPYEEGTDFELARTMEVTSSTTETGWVLEAACPRCSHPISKFVDAEGFGIGVATIDALRAEDPIRTTVVLRCNCGTVHPGTPSGKSGCGFYAGREISIPGR